MNEMDDKKLEQVAGGACYDHKVLWEECQRKNCDGCAKRSSCNQLYLGLELNAAITNAQNNGCAVVIPSCRRRK